MSTENDGNSKDQSPNGPDSPAQIEATVTPTRQRSRRRVAITTLTAGVLIAGTIIGIQQLSGTRDDSPNLAVPPTPAPEVSSSTGASTVPETNDAVTATTVPGPNLNGEGTDPTLAFLESKATPAQAVPANITWTVLDANSPEALAYQFDATQLYALATVPATSPFEVDKLALFEQVNGSWNQLPFDYPEGLDPMMAGDTVYGIGRAPATPGGPIGSFGTFDVASGTWRLHELPDQLVPYESDAITSELYYHAVPVDDGLIAFVTSSINIQPGKYRDLFDTVEIGPIINGDALLVFNDCEDGMDAALADTDEAPTQDQYLELARKYCTEKSIDASEVGLTQADLEALVRYESGPDSSPLWKVTADSMVPFDVPGYRTDDLTNYVGLDGDEVIVTGNEANSATTRYVIGDDGSLHQVFKDLTDELGSYSTGSVANPDFSTALGGVSQYLLTERAGSPTQITDVLSVTTTPEMIYPTVSLVPAGISGQLSVLNAHLTYNPPGTVTEQKTVSDSGYTLNMSGGADTGFIIIDDATGEPPSFTYGLSTESGKVQLIRYPDPSSSSNDSQAPPMFDDGSMVATFDIDWKTVPGFNRKWRSTVLTTTDGVNVAVSDMESILRQSVTVAENEKVNPHSAKIIEGRIVVPVSVYSDSTSESTGQDFLVVGTPN